MYIFSIIGIFHNLFAAVYKKAEGLVINFVRWGGDVIFEIGRLNLLV